MGRNDGDMAIPEIGFGDNARVGNTNFSEYYKKMLEAANIKRLKAPISFNFGGASDSSNKAALNFSG